MHRLFGPSAGWKMRVESNGPGFGCQGLRNPAIIEDGLSLGLWYTQHLCFALGWAHRAVAQFGSAPALGAGCRRFKSCQPDHESPTPALNRTPIVGLKKFRFDDRRCGSFVCVRIEGDVTTTGSGARRWSSSSPEPAGTRSPDGLPCWRIPRETGSGCTDPTARRRQTL